jgi:thiamine-phosphate pyrophosphorylase
MLATGACQTCGVEHRRKPLSEARLYLVCDARPDAFLHAVLDGGVDIVQLRIKDGSESEILAAAARFKRICAEHGTLFLLNDSPELAVEADADGVHLGQEDTPVPRAREIVGRERLVGLSTHSEEQILGADGADYIGVGPIYTTPTKPGRPGVGLELVRFATRSAGVPFFAIGGIDIDNVEQVRDAGAGRVAVVRALTEAPDPNRSASTLRGARRAGVRVGAA